MIHMQTHSRCHQGCELHLLAFSNQSFIALSKSCFYSASSIVVFTVGANWQAFHVLISDEFTLFIRKLVVNLSIINLTVNFFFDKSSSN